MPTLPTGTVTFLFTDVRGAAESLEGLAAIAERERDGSRAGVLRDPADALRHGDGATLNEVLAYVVRDDACGPLTPAGSSP